MSRFRISASLGAGGAGRGRSIERANDPPPSAAITITTAPPMLRPRIPIGVTPNDDSRPPSTSGRQIRQFGEAR
jgi:hypothetical protein